MTAAVYPSLNGKSVYITGGATGIGAALVTAFAQQGARVHFVDFAKEAGRALAEKTGGQSPRPVTFEALDVTDVAALKSSVAAHAGEAGLDVLVNNVANDTRHAPLEIDESYWRKCLAVNLDAAFFASQQALAAMRAEGRGGAIVNFSSINAHIAPPDMPGYVASKAGILGLTKALARQFGPDGIRVNAVLPGWIATERQLASWLTPEAEAAWEERVALKGRIPPEAVASLVLFLAADDSAKITGQEFTVDAGVF